MNMYLLINDIMTELFVISTKLKSQRRLANYFQINQIYTINTYKLIYKSIYLYICLLIKLFVYHLYIVW